MDHFLSQAELTPISCAPLVTRVFEHGYVLMMTEGCSVPLVNLRQDYVRAYRETRTAH